MILWEIFKALENCAGLDSGTECVYNIFKREHRKGRRIGMDGQVKDFLDTHPEAAEIFKLADMMQESGFDFYFSFDDDYPLLGDDGFDEEHEYMIETQTGELVGSRAPITIFLNRDGEPKDGLELLDMRPARGIQNASDSDGEFHTGLTADEAMEIIEKFFEEA